MDSLVRIENDLYAAGYHRVRLSLSSFDKVLGGLCWAIALVTSSWGENGADGGNLSADVVFEESWDIGRKIRAAENAVRALRAMRCPFALQAHQIQGGDFRAMEPILRWLTQRAMITRDALGDVNRAVAEDTFERRELKTNVQCLQSRKNAAKGAVEAVEEVQKPRRKLRVDVATLGELQRDEEARVRAVLLEFGENAAARETMFEWEKEEKRINGGSMFEKKYQAMVKQAMREEEARRKNAEDMEKRIMKDTVVARATYLVPLEMIEKNKEMVELAKAEYDKRQEQNGRESKAGREEHERRRVETLKIRIERANRRLSRIENVRAEKESEAILLEEEVQEEMQKIDLALAEINRLEMAGVAFGGASESHLFQLRDLVEKAERLRLREKEFKAQCKKKKAKLEEELALAEQGRSGENSAALEEEASRLQEQKYAQVKKKHDKFRKVLAECNQLASSLSRKLDDIPTKSELMQYEMRFVELYEQLAAKLEENRRHVTTYNGLETTLELLEKESSLLQSINETFQISMRSSRGKDEFLAQFKTIISGLQSRHDQLKQKHQETQKRFDQQEQEYRSLIDYERQYFDAVKQFQQACDLNELLQLARAQMEESQTS